MEAGKQLLVLRMLQTEDRCRGTTNFCKLCLRKQTGVTKRFTLWVEMNTGPAHKRERHIHAFATVLHRQ
jgi:hypothetical protein